MNPGGGLEFGDSTDRKITQRGLERLASPNFSPSTPFLTDKKTEYIKPSSANGKSSIDSPDRATLRRREMSDARAARS
jgi:hypothetical protein